VDSARPERKTAKQEYLVKRSEERNMDSGLMIQLEEDGDDRTRELDGVEWSVDFDPLGVTRQSRMESSGLWIMIHWD